MANETIIKNGVLTNVISNEAKTINMTYTASLVGGQPGWMFNSSALFQAAGGLTVGMASLDAGGDPLGIIAILDGSNSIGQIMCLTESPTSKKSMLSLGGGLYSGKISLLDASTYPGVEKAAINVDPINGGIIQLYNMAVVPKTISISVDSLGNLTFQDEVVGASKTLAELLAGGEGLSSTLAIGNYAVLTSTQSLFDLQSPLVAGSTAFKVSRTSDSNYGVKIGDAINGVAGNLTVNTVSYQLFAVTGTGTPNVQVGSENNLANLNVYGSLVVFESGLLPNKASISLPALAADITLDLPITSGTLALTSALGSYLPLGGGVMTGNITMTTAGWIGLGAAKGRLIFTDAGTDTLGINDADLDMIDHNILNALTVQLTEGSYLKNAIKTGIVGIAELVDSIPETNGSGVVWHYTVRDSTGANLRAGTITAVWEPGSIKFAETSTLSIGVTTDLAFTVTEDSTNVYLNATRGGGALSWDVRVIRNLI